MNYKIEFDNANGYIKMFWKGYSSTKEFRQGAEMMLSLLVKHDASKVLGDIKEMIIISSEDQKWLNEDFLPRAIKKGLKIMALVQPVHYWNNVAVQEVSYKVDKQRLTIQFFKDFESAKMWLMQI